MPSVIMAKMDGSDAIRFNHKSLVQLYLGLARDHVSRAFLLPPGEDQLRESLSAVLFSSLCLEAFVNEAIEDFISGEELEEFHRARGKYRRKGETTTVAWKLKLLFQLAKRHVIALEEEPLTSVNRLFSLRNDLVHYKYTKAAGRSVLNTSFSELGLGSRRKFSISLIQEPTSIEPPLVARVTLVEACRSANTAVGVLKLWAQRDGASEVMIEEYDRLLLSIPPGPADS